MTEETATEFVTPPAPKRSHKAKSKSATVSKKKRPSAASSKPASARKKRPVKRGSARKPKTPGHWSKTHAQLVLHAHPSLVARLDRKLAALGKKLKLDRVSRGSVLRALVEKAVA